MSKPNYAGFWVRVGASIIDTLLILLVLGPLITAIYGRAYWVIRHGHRFGCVVKLPVAAASCDFVLGLQIGNSRKNDDRFTHNRCAHWS